MLDPIKKGIALIIAAFSDLKENKILALSLVPTGLALLTWACLLYLSWPLLQGYFSTSSWWAFAFSILAIIILMPILAISGLALTSMLAMPVITSYVQQKYYPGFERKHGYGLLASFRNSLIFWLVYMILLLATLWSWFLPFAGLIVSVCLNAFVNRKILYFDAMAEIASKEEFHTIQKDKNIEIWVLAFLLAGLMLVPGYFLLAPVHATIVFSRFAFGELHLLREKSAKLASSVKV